MASCQNAIPAVLPNFVIMMFFYIVDIVILKQGQNFKLQFDEFRISSHDYFFTKGSA